MEPPYGGGFVSERLGAERDNTPNQGQFVKSNRVTGLVAHHSDFKAAVLDGIDHH